MVRSRFLGMVAVAVALPLGAAVTGWNGSGTGAGAGAAGPSLTIYSGNLALVRMEVERALREGAHTVRIDGLPSNIDPSSLIVLNRGVTLLGVHGQRSYQDASTGPGTSLDLDLEVGRRVERLELAFLTGGLSWAADYSLIVEPDDASAKLDGYATVMNGSGTSYEAAEVQLLAGTISRSGIAGGWEADDLRMARALQEAAAPGVQEAAFGDYHLYTISAPLNLRAGERRRIRLLGAPSVKTTKEYVFSHSVNYRQPYREPLARPVATYYRVERPRASEFGAVPLPAGQVRIYQRDQAGRVQLLGIAGIPNTPAGEELRLGTGLAFDIVGTRTQTDYKRPSGNVYESAWKVELRNASERDATVQVIERLSGEWEIVESTQGAEKLSAGAVRFRVDVPAGGSATLEYRVVVRT